VSSSTGAPSLGSSSSLSKPVAPLVHTSGDNLTAGEKSANLTIKNNKIIADAAAADAAALLGGDGQEGDNQLKPIKYGRMDMFCKVLLW
jgi:hypothetical protein